MKQPLEPQAPQYTSIPLQDVSGVQQVTTSISPWEPNSPRRLDDSRIQRRKILRVLLDFAVALIALLYMIFGALVYKNDGEAVVPRSQGTTLLSVAKYGPTVFPVLFAAVVGGAMKTGATWSVQRGTRLGHAEQLLGSRTLTTAITTQAQLRSFNVMALGIVVLWALSPLGSQAALRVINSVNVSIENNITLAVMESFAEYRYGNANGLAQGGTTIKYPFAAALMSARLLKDRNQDLWQNLRVPCIETFGTGTDNTSWISIDDSRKVEYPSLVGIPVATLPDVGNTTFTMSGSYLSLECPVLRFLNDGEAYGGFNETKPESDYDCRWASAMGTGNNFRIGISLPCGPTVQEPRTPRKLIWESNPKFASEHGITHAECDLFTSYVDMQVSCQGTSCSPTAVRRTPKPPRHRSITVLDYSFGTQGFLDLFAGVFLLAGVSGTQNPSMSYMLDPYNAVTSTNRSDVGSLSKETFQIRLAQQLNAQLVLGISPEDVTGNFTGASVTLNFVNNVTATTTTHEERIHCDLFWLAILLISSVVLLLTALGATILRYILLLPDVLGSLSLPMLNNQHDGTSGASTWDTAERTRRMKNLRIRLGDIRPDEDCGEIALVAPMEQSNVARVRRGRFYR